VLTIDRPWTTQPRRHVRLLREFADGAFFWTPSYGDMFVEHVLNRTADAALNISYAELQHSNGLVSARIGSVATSNYIQWPTDDDFDPPVRGYSMFMLGRRLGNGTSAYPRVWHRDVRSTAGDGFGFLLASSADGTAPNSVYFSNQSAGVNTNIGYVSGNPIASSNEFWYYCFTHDGTTGHLYVNGVPISSVACSVPASSTRVMRLGRNTTATATGAPFDVACAGYLRYPLPRELTRSPWQLLEPIRRRIPVLTVAGAAPTITALSAINITATSAQPRITYA
jgi:hypothetical protein